MFNLIPWKKQTGNLKVRHDRPVWESDRDDYALARLRDDFDALMRHFFDDRWLGNRLMGAMPDPWEAAQQAFNGDLGWEDKENEYVVHAELPGFDAEDFDVKLSSNTLTVRAEHKDETREDNGGASYRYGSFTRTFTVPRGVDEENVKARYHSGVLEVHLPKTERARGKRIEVQKA